MMRSLILILLLPAAALAAPVDGYVPPDDVGFRGGRDGDVPAEPWWTEWSELDGLVDEGLARNHDLAAAQARIIQAQALAGQAFAPILPTLGVGASITSQPQSQLGRSFGVNNPNATDALNHNGGVTLQGDWTLDVFARQILSWQAAEKDRKASEWDGRSLSLNVAGMIGEAWIDLAHAQARLELLKSQSELNQNLLAVIEGRYRAGTVSGLDVLQQRQQAAAARANLPGAEAAARRQQQRIGVLLGRPAGQDLPTAAALPDLPPAAATGKPADLLEHRPELLAARLRVRSARDRKGSAIAALAPTLGVSADAGVQFIGTEELDSWEMWQIGATMSLPILQGGRRIQAIRQQQAAEWGAGRDFSQTVLEAIQSVEGALANDDGMRAALVARQEQVDAARLAYAESRDRYLGGLDSYLSLLTSFSTLQQAELGLLQAHRDALVAHLQLRQAVAGPWAQALGGSR
jgi:multidrug efflux system outer membrane protein